MLSKENVTLALSRGMFTPHSKEEAQLPFRQITPNNDGEVCTYFRPSRTTTGLTIVIVDKTNKEQYSMGINFNTKKITFKLMTYEKPHG